VFGLLFISRFGYFTEYPGLQADNILYFESSSRYLVSNENENVVFKANRELTRKDKL